jgi:polyhydroxyalkanoate synthase subunit PhaC
VHHVADLLPGAPEVRLETCPGGHLGVLTGRSALHTTWRLLDWFFAAAPEQDQRRLRVVA